MKQNKGVVHIWEVFGTVSDNNLVSYYIKHKNNILPLDSHFIFH